MQMALYSNIQPTKKMSLDTCVLSISIVAVHRHLSKFKLTDVNVCKFNGYNLPTINSCGFFITSITIMMYLLQVIVCSIQFDSNKLYDSRSLDCLISLPMYITASISNCKLGIHNKFRLVPNCAVSSNMAIGKAFFS